MPNAVDGPLVIFGGEGNDEMLEEGIYPVTVTSSDRYVSEESVDSVIYEGLSDVLEDEDSYRILDIGSSSGEALKTLTRKLEGKKGCKFEKIGLDVDQEMAKRGYEDNFDYVLCAAAQNIPLESDSVDIVVSSQLHLNSEDIEKVVSEASRVLDSEGYAVLSTGYEDVGYKGLHEGKIR